MAGCATVEEQYSSAAYSKFVEAPSNRALYTEYYHYTFMSAVRALMAEREGPYAVLDAGAGNAVLSRKIAAVSPRVVCTGVDVSLAMIAAGRRLVEQEGLADRVSLVEGDLRTGAGLAGVGPFDLGVSGFVVCHMHSEAELTEFFCNIATALRPGGATVHIVPHVDAGAALEDGAVRRVEIPLPADAEGGGGGAIALYDVHWSEEAIGRAVAAAGLVDFRFEEAAMRPGSQLERASLPGLVSILCARRPVEGR